jgi:hypothetical protein
MHLIENNAWFASMVLLLFHGLHENWADEPSRLFRMLVTNIGTLGILSFPFSCTLIVLHDHVASLSDFTILMGAAFENCTY